MAKPKSKNQKTKDTSIEIRFVKSEEGDWVGMYINDNLAIEGHSLDYFDILTQLHPYLPSLEISSTTKTQEWFDKHNGSCPLNLKE